MKRNILVVAGVAALTLGAYFASQLFAQQPNAAASPQQVGRVVAVVNIGQVFNEYVRAKAFKEELERTLKPYKDKGKQIADQMKMWQEQLQRPGIDAKSKEKLEADFRASKRVLEDMQLEVQRLIGKKQEDNLVTLWKEVNLGIHTIAKTYGYHVVFAYGDPMDKALLEQFPNINRKMQAMDQGSMVPLYVHESADISNIVVRTLNAWVEGANKK